MENGKANDHKDKIKAALVKFLIYLANGILVSLIIRRVVVISNDKAILLFMFYYPFVFILNMIIGRILKRYRPATSDIFMEVAICLMILYFPIAFLLSEY